MVTCKYCGTKLSFVGAYKTNTYFHCDFCEMNFTEDQVCENKKRKVSVPEYYNDNYYKSTPELLKCNTIELFHVLRDCRKDWYAIYKLLKDLKRLNNNPDKKTKKTKESVETYNSLFKDYEDLTKRKFVIENIILEKAGYLPEKLTEEFLHDLVEQGRNSSSKPMHIYISTK